MSFWKSREVKKTKKLHRCAFCGRTIHVGSSCHNETGVYEWDFQSYYFCNRCKKYIEDNNYDLSEGFDSCELYNAVQDKELCPECKHRPDECTWSNNDMTCTYSCGDCENTWTMDYSMGVTDEPKKKGV